MSQVAERLFDLGQAQAAKAIVDEALPTARQLPKTDWNDSVRGGLAEVVALFDTKSALGLVEGRKGVDQQLGGIAHRLAGTNPQAAEQVLNMLAPDKHYSSEYAVRVCHRLATKDLPRARALVDRMGRADLVPHALGVMAWALADTETDAARGLLRQAFVACGEQGQTTLSRKRMLPYAIALTRIAEKVDPASLHEYLWRAISQYPGPDDDPDPEEELEDKAKLAILLAMYDFQPELQRALMVAVEEHLANLKRADNQLYRFAITALTLRDPDRAVEWHQAYLAKAGSEDPPYAYTHIAGVIAKPRRELWDQFQRDLRVWTSDERD